MTVSVTLVLFFTPILLRSGNNEKSHIGAGRIAMGDSVDITSIHAKGDGHGQAIFWNKLSSMS